MVLSCACASSKAVLFSWRDSVASLATICAASFFFSSAFNWPSKTALPRLSSSMVCSAFSSFRRRPASTADTASSRMTGSGSATSAPSDLNAIFARCFCSDSSPAWNPSMSSRRLLREACRASERVRMVASDSMNPDSVNVSTVPEDEETMVPDGKRMSWTFLLASVSAIIASS